MKYTESPQSEALYKINEEWLLYKNAPELIKKQSVTHYLWCGIHILAKFMRQYVVENKFYKKKTVLCEKRYSVDHDLIIEKIPRIAVYTCIVGKYDNLLEPLFKTKNCDYYAVTDFEIPSDKTIWKRIDINETGAKDLKDSTYKARYIKLHPHELFPEYDISVWVDGNVVVCTDIIPEVAKLQEKFFAAHMHPWRYRLKDEMDAVIHHGRKADIEKMRNQVHSYYEKGYRDQNKIIETTMLIRRHNDEKCIVLMNKWWGEIVSHSTRDQLSLPYVLFDLHYTLKDIAILGNNMRLNPRFRYLDHCK